MFQITKEVSPRKKEKNSFTCGNCARQMLPWLEKRQNLFAKMLRSLGFFVDNKCGHLSLSFGGISTSVTASSNTVGVHAVDPF